MTYPPTCSVCLPCHDLPCPPSFLAEQDLTPQHLCNMLHAYALLDCQHLLFVEGAVREVRLRAERERGHVGKGEGGEDRHLLLGNNAATLLWAISLLGRCGGGGGASYCADCGGGGGSSSYAG